MFKVKKLSPNAIIPIRATEGSAGLDISSIEDTIVPAKEWRAVSTGISISVPIDCYARIAPRSGLTFKKGINVGAGVVDSSYTGEVKVILFNHSNEDFEIKSGDRIAQVIFEKIYINDLIEVDELDSTERGDNGFGSTGV
jgi:dUTP pyrophosphatase